MSNEIKSKVANDSFRTTTLEEILKFLLEKGEDVYRVANNAIAFPFVNVNKEEGWLKIVASVPSGSTIDKLPYDGYDEAENYASILVKKEEEAKVSQEKKDKKIASDAKTREAAKKKRESKNKPKE